MPFSRLIFLAFVLLGGCGWSRLVAAGEPRTILAFGDSITQRGYRHVLVPELKKLGAAVRFIGPETDAVSAHAGYGGNNTAQLKSRAEAIYRKFPADIVLLHSGHNSFSENHPVPGIVRDSESMIEIMAAINPKVIVLLAQVIPAGKLPKYEYIPELNRALAESAARMVAKGYRVILVDQAKGFDWQADTVDDKVHPNAAGAVKISARWLDALRPLITFEQPSRTQD